MAVNLEKPWEGAKTKDGKVEITQQIGQILYVDASKIQGLESISLFTKTKYVGSLNRGSVELGYLANPLKLFVGINIAGKPRKVKSPSGTTKFSKVLELFKAP